MGTPDFSVPCLQALLRAGYEVAAVFTQPDKARGRSGALTPCPVKAEALQHDIPVYTPVRVREEESVKILQDLAPDVIVAVAYGQILPQKILDLPPYGCINVHASLLPAWRGSAPIQWAVINGDRVSGVTVMQMNAGLDTGDMLLRSTVELAPDETGGSLFDKLSVLGADLLVEALRGLEAGSIVPEKQPEESPTPYAKMLTKQLGRIDWTMDAAAIERLTRGLAPWPSAYTTLNGKQLKIWKARVAENGSGEEKAPAPGTVTQADAGSLTVQTGSGTLQILQLQLEGKKSMTTEAFLRGNKVTPGTILG